MASGEQHTETILSLFLRKATEAPKATAMLSYHGHDPGNYCDEISRVRLLSIAKSIVAAIESATSTRGVRIDGPIALCFKNSTVGSIAGMFASLHMQQLFLPIDASERLESWCTLLDEIGCTVVVCDRESSSAARDLARARFVVNVDDVVAAKTFDENLVANWAQKESLRTEFDDIMFIMHTSGSTGVPKYVKCTQSGTINRVDWATKRHPWEDTDICIAKTSLAFIDHIAECFAPLIGGVPLVVGAAQTSEGVPVAAKNWRDPCELVEACQRCAVTRLVVTPSLLRELLHANAFGDDPRNDASTCGAPLSTLLFAHCSGEALTWSLANEVVRVASRGFTLLNLYGSTECAATDTGADVLCFAFRFEDSQKISSSNVPIGTTLPNSYVLLLQLQENKEGGHRWVESDEGELFVGRVQEEGGYLDSNTEATGSFLDLREVNDAELPTGSKHPRSFEQVSLHNHSERAGSQRFLRMADLAKYVDDSRSNLELIGRVDSIVKIRGAKVSLLEVEDQCRQVIEQASDAVAQVLVNSSKFGQEATLVAAIRWSPTARCPKCVDLTMGSTAAALSVMCMKCTGAAKRALTEVLPKASIPSFFFLGDLPTTLSGKIDRFGVKQLLKTRRSDYHMLASLKQGTQHFTKVTERDWVDWLVLSFTEVLGLRDDAQVVNGDSNFYDLGGDSLRAIRLLNLVSKEAATSDLLGWRDGAKKPLLVGFESLPTPRALAILLLDATTATTSRDSSAAVTSQPFHRGASQPSHPAALQPPPHHAAPPFVVKPVEESDVEEVCALAADEFCANEPVTASFLRSESERNRYQRVLCQWQTRLLQHENERGLSFVCRDAQGTVVGFSLTNTIEDIAEPRPVPPLRAPSILGFGCVECSGVFMEKSKAFINYFTSDELPELQPAFSMFKEMFHQWKEQHGKHFSSGEWLYINMSGCSHKLRNGGYVVRLCEAAVVEEATRRGFKVITTINTGAVTRHVSEVELGFKCRVTRKTADELKKHGAAEMDVAAIDCHHIVALYDKFLRPPHFDSIQFKVTELNDAPADSVTQVDEVLREAFRYRWPSDIVREMRHLRERRDGVVHSAQYQVVSGDDAIVVVVAAALVITSLGQPQDSPRSSSGRGMGLISELILLGVLTDYRSFGIASRLLEGLVETHLVEDGSMVFLYALPKLRGIYERRGFRIPTAPEVDCYLRHQNSDQRPEEARQPISWPGVLLVNRKHGLAP